MICVPRLENTNYGKLAAYTAVLLSSMLWGGTVPEACCEGIEAVDAGSNTVAEDRATCSCIMDGLSHILLINYDLVATLPEACGTPCPYKITSTTDCSK
ncbi:hypothetical protein I3760_14G052400 [Carya illinoinensis]|nr:hypothetical protein I3760_14G052400 [Carya illinoinensis]